MTADSHAGTSQPFSTSGTTDRPVRWWRTAEQLAAEVELVAGTLVGAVDHVVNFAPTAHVFGHLFGVVLPQRNGITVDQAWQRPVTSVPPLPADARTLLVCVPSAWPLLRRLTGMLAELPLVVALHSTAPVTALAADVVDGMPADRFRAFEILGSTETGGIAHRPVPGSTEKSPLWTLFEDVSPASPVERNGVSRLHVTSQRIGRRDDMAERPESWMLDDVVSYRGDRRFEHLGRASRLVKSNGRRVQLEHVESALRRADPALDAVCLPVSDPVRGESYDIYYAVPEGASPAKTTPAAVRRLLHEAMADVAAPRRVYPVPSIPRTPRGRVQLTELELLARSEIATAERSADPLADVPRS
jgi:acyl-coenzyme A synthetase/AMP-(fatty) acid ligase